MLLRSYIKQPLIKIIKGLDITLAWLTVPVYSWQMKLSVHRVGFRPVVSVPRADRFNAHDEIISTLEILSDTLTKADIDFFVVPGSRGRYSLAVMSGDRIKTINTLNRQLHLPGYYYNLKRYRHNTDIPHLLDKGIGQRFTDNICAVSIYRNIGAHSQRLMIGEFYAVTIEFWSKPEDMNSDQLEQALAESGILDESILDGSIIAPLNNGVAKVFSKNDQVYSSIRVGDRQYKTLEIFTKDLLGKVNFPIDIVYTWVDGSDPKWLKKYEAARREIDPAYNNNSKARYTDHDELKYSLRSIEMYAPWVRNIYIVTDNQKPKWLDLGKDSKVKLIHHQDIFSDPAVLPVFNSQAIESQMHHIEGLSEHYLYLNDDMFFARPTAPEDFFFPNGVARVQPSGATIGTGNPTDHETAPSSAGKNARKIIDNKFRRYITTKFCHTPLPNIKSIAEIIEKEYRNEIDTTMRSRFRMADNVAFATTLMQSYLLASGDGVPLRYRSVTIDVSKPESQHAMRSLLRQWSNTTICLNETITPDHEFDAVYNRTRVFLDKHFPYPSRWENRIDIAK